MIQDKELWLPCVGYDGYLVSNHGNVMSIKSKKIIAKQKQILDTYYRVEIRRNGERCVQNIHRLVAEAFIPNTENKPYVNHIDGNPLNNHVSNLEWCTPSENRIHSQKMGLQGKKDIPIRQISMNGDFIRNWESSEQAACSLGINQSHIIACCRNKRRHTANFRWQYIDSKFKYDYCNIGYRHDGKVAQFEKENDVPLKIYDNAEATRIDGFTPNNVRQVCRGEKKSHNGFVWKHWSQ